MWTLILLFVLAGVAASLLILRALRAPAETHERIEYYRGWNGDRYPRHLENKISKAEAEAAAARGGAYLIGYYGADGRLDRVVKMYRGAVFFEDLYTYHPNGRLKRAQVTNPQGMVTVLDYDESGMRKTYP